MYKIEPYKNFQVASYVNAYYTSKISDEQLGKDIEKFLYYVPLKKVYIENHRGLVDVPKERMVELKKIYESYGIEVSGGITATVLVDDERKPSIFDTFCYTDPRHRERFLKLVEDLASVVDEIILDDFFFTACRCEMCIEAKGEQTWAEYRLNLLEEFSKEIVARAKEINPKMNFIIKYPAWYKSYHETGYYPEKQKDIFDMIYTGTETREAVYNAQHLQRYHSYAIMRLEENMAPGKNGGGWIDPGGAGDNINRFLEQAEHTMFAKAKELMLYNFEIVLDPTIKCLPALGWDLIRVDDIVGKIGKPIGVSAYEPYNSDGEDLLYNFLGMGGIAVEPEPDFNEKAPVILITETCKKDEQIVEKMKAYLKNGGNIVMTTGFFKAMYDRGIRDLTSVQLTGRCFYGKEFTISNRNYTSGYFAYAKELVLFDILQYKDNASWSDITIVCNELNGPLLTEEDYGKGRFFILNVPQNHADLYKLPEKVWETIAKHMSMGQKVYVASDEKCSFFAYDNNVYGVMNYAPHESIIRVIIRGECKGLQDIETGEIMDLVIPMPKPEKQVDAASVIPEESEFAVDIRVNEGAYRFFRVL